MIHINNELTFENLSGTIKGFVKTLTESEKDYQYSMNQIKLCDQKTQDILHRMELDSLVKGERNKLATELSRVRKTRRTFKDISEATQPVYEFLQSDKGKQLYNALTEIQGKTKKIEGYHANRQYYMRIPEGNKQVITHK